MTTFVERSIEVEVPVRTAYDQWTQFEEFPRFMAGVREVRQTGDALTHWVAEIGGVKREWDAAIVEQVPDEKVAWAATTGATNAGAVYFTAAGADRTQVRLTLEFEPEGIVERIGDVFDIVDRQAVADLDRFKEYIEREGSATGGWRGTVEEGNVHDDGTDAEDLRAAADASADDVSGDLVAVGPTGGTRGTVETEPGPARVDATDDLADEDAGVGHSGDPIAVDPPPVERTGGAGATAGTGGGSEYADTPDLATTVPSRTERTTLDNVDAPGSADGIGGSLDPLDPRAGTADDPDNPNRPAV